jgi:SsrA-binding protein
MLKTINILNKRARFDYEIIEKFTGIVLAGTEIKSIDSERQILPKVL